VLQLIGILFYPAVGAFLYGVSLHVDGGDLCPWKMLGYMLLYPFVLLAAYGNSCAARWLK
jgi:hypothetical protein